MSLNLLAPLRGFRIRGLSPLNGERLLHYVALVMLLESLLCLWWELVMMPGLLQVVIPILQDNHLAIEIDSI